jgi:hypothetical protein
MSLYHLKMTLLSDTTFGRGDGVAGLVDVEVQYDDYGCPFLSGRTLKGLLVQECADILAVIAAGEGEDGDWKQAAACLFGGPGSDEQAEGNLMVGNAQLPQDLRDAIRQDIEAKRLTPREILESLTAMRTQTAMDESGVPRKHTLRTSRVILRETTFEAELELPSCSQKETDVLALQLLAASVKGLRRVGTGRTRGRGKVKVGLYDAGGEPCSDDLFTAFSEQFAKEVVPS